MDIITPLNDKLDHLMNIISRPLNEIRKRIYKQDNDKISNQENALDKCCVEHEPEDTGKNRIEFRLDLFVIHN